MMWEVSKSTMLRVGKCCIVVGSNYHKGPVEPKDSGETL